VHENTAAQPFAFEGQALVRVTVASRRDGLGTQSIEAGVRSVYPASFRQTVYQWYVFVLEHELATVAEVATVGAAEELAIV
jgi:hypothetical protein